MMFQEYVKRLISSYVDPRKSISLLETTIRLISYHAQYVSLYKIFFCNVIIWLKSENKLIRRICEYNSNIDSFSVVISIGISCGSQPKSPIGWRQKRLSRRLLLWMVEIILKQLPLYLRPIRQLQQYQPLLHWQQALEIINKLQLVHLLNHQLMSKWLSFNFFWPIFVPLVPINFFMCLRLFILQ